MILYIPENVKIEFIIGAGLEDALHIFNSS